jgi:hypothetical protein
MTLVADSPTIAPDREVEQKKAAATEPPRIPCPCAAGRQRRQVVLRLRSFVEHVRYGRRLPSLPSPVV